jgi:hypothetical protein
MEYSKKIYLQSLNDYNQIRNNKNNIYDNLDIENFKKFYLINRRVYEKLQYSKEPTFKCYCGGKYKSPGGLRHMKTKKHKIAESCVAESWSKLVLHFIN